MAFFDNLGKKISQAGQDALQKTREMADMAKINSMIADEEKRINNIYYQIGKMYAVLHLDDYENCFSSLMDSLNESENKIENLKVKIQELKNVSKCVHCGAEVSATAKYCNACGNAITNNSVDVFQDSNMIKCDSCGNMIKKDMNFCTKCGTPIVHTVDSTNIIDDAKSLACPQCGAGLSEDSAFCTECGTKL